MDKYPDIKIRERLHCRGRFVRHVDSLRHNIQSTIVTDTNNEFTIQMVLY